jgi:UDP-glucose 4-epimerase
MTYVSDVVEATVAALEAPPGGVYNVGGGARTTINELIENVRHALDTPVEVSYGPVSEGDVRSTWADLERVERELNYRPRVSLEEGIKAQAEWVLEEGLASSPVGGSANPSGEAAR